MDCHYTECKERNNESRYPPEDCPLPYYDDMSGKTVWLVWLSKGEITYLREICTKKHYAESWAEELRRRHPNLVVSIEEAPVDHPFGKKTVKEVFGE